jgi:Ca2+-binding EF-hand superfamily protein
MGGGKMNPDMIFNMMSQGKDYIVIAEMWRDKDKAEDYAKRKGITNGQLTREQFADYLQERFAERQASRGGPGGAPASADPAKDYFDRLDRNKDGVLTDNEIPGGLRADLGKWDVNRDGKIQLDEYRAYFKANTPADAAVAATSIAPTQASPLDELDKRATVYRAGNLPPELQRTWFEDYDTDKDGQVGLYEWKASGRTVPDFRAIDSNGDGFITAEEALRWVRKNGGGNTTGTRVAAAGPGGRGQGMGGRNGLGSWPGAGGGQGGPGRWPGAGGQNGFGGGQGGGRWPGAGGPGGFGRGPSASSNGNNTDRQRGGGGRRQRGGGGMNQSWPGSP